VLPFQGADRLDPAVSRFEQMIVRRR
jgi:hypothetical protein